MPKKGKAERLEHILELIRDNEIDRQEQLAEYLRRDGFPSTQATVSRDIRELHLKKRPGSSGKLVYTAVKGEEAVQEAKYIRILRESFISMDIAVNILVIRTVPGMAMAAAAALDECRFHEIAGCIAGDDTIFCAVRSVPDTVQLKEKIEEILA